MSEGPDDANTEGTDGTASWVTAPVRWYTPRDCLQQRPLASFWVVPGRGTYREEGARMSAPILATKLYLPPPRPGAVPRPRLLARLDAGLGRRLTIVSAPAGFGKTTLVGAWVAACGRPTAWLSLDDGDSDPVRFLTYLIGALRTIAPEFG